MSAQNEDTPEIRRNKILGNALGIEHTEVANYVTSIQKKDGCDEYIIYFSIQTPESTRLKVQGLAGGLFVGTGPIDFEGLQISFN